MHPTPTPSNIRVEVRLIVSASSGSRSIAFSAPMTSSWRDVLQQVRQETVLAAEDSAVAIFLVDEFPAPEAENGPIQKGTRVNLDDRIGQVAPSRRVRLLMRVKRQYPGIMIARTREFQRLSVAYNRPIGPSGSHLAEYTIVTPAADASTSLLHRKYLRTSDTIVWDLVYGHASKSNSVPPLALLGSPGCGKSSLAQRLAVVLSRSNGQDVMYLQQVTAGLTKLHLFTKWSCVTGIIYDCAVPQLIRLLSVIEGRLLNPYIIVDGFTEAKLSQLWHYNLVVTSGAFNEACMGSNLVLLPSWTVEELLQLGAQADVLTPTEIEKRYANFGGDERSIFNEDQDAATRALHAAVDRVSDDNVSLLLPSSGRSSNKQVDRLRRFRLKKMNDMPVPNHFQDPSQWIGQIESSTVQRALVQQLPLQWFDDLLRRAKGTPLYGKAYEMSIQARPAHKEIFAFSSLVCKNLPTAPRRGPPRAAKGEVKASVFETNPDLLTAIRVVLDISTPICEGRTKKSALETMKKVPRGEATYWAPAFPTFQAVEAVARCTVDPKDSETPIKAIALLQMTVSDTKTVDTTLLKEVVDGLAIDKTSEKLPLILLFVSPPDVDLSVNIVPEDIATFTAKFDALLPSPYHTTQNNST